MAAELFIGFGKLAISGLDKPKNQINIVLNSFRASIRGTIGSGGTALVSFIFSRYLIQNEPWKSIAPYVIKATLWSCGTFAAVTAYIVYNIVIDPDQTDASAQPINTKVSLIAKNSALVGLMGAAAAALATYYVKESSLAKHSLVPLLGIGAAGLILWIFTNQQNRQYHLGAAILERRLLIERLAV
jgi:hypothetical protein